MPTSKEGRRTTLDQREHKTLRVWGALHDPKYMNLPNREIARLIGVDESMVRRARQKLTQPTAARIKKNTASKKSRSRP